MTPYVVCGGKRRVICTVDLQLNCVSVVVIQGSRNGKRLRASSGVSVFLAAVWS